VSAPRELVKLYYRIGEVSQIVGVQPHVLRYWETEFRTIRPQKSHKGQRVYSRRDVEKLLRVKDLLRNQGFTIAGARKRLSDAPEAAPASGGHSSAPLSAAVHVIGAVSPAAVSQLSAPAAVPVEESDAGVAERGLPEQGNSEHGVSNHAAKDMRKALLGLRQDLMQMLDQLSAQARDSHSS
jgi:DNA-binding transcriptional MerR regulator